MVLLLALFVAESTDTAGWVPGTSVVIGVALLGAVALGAAAMLGVPSWLALGAGALAAPVVASYAAGVGPGLLPLQVATWAREVAAGAAGVDDRLLRAVLCLLLWLAGGWLAWSALRWRKSMLGLGPAGVVMATNVLNFPSGQDFFVLAFLVLALTLLIWTTYQRSVLDAVRRQLAMTPDTRWDFWERGVMASAAVIALGVLLPPLTVTDRTFAIQNGLLNAWGDAIHRFDPNAPGGGSGVGGARSVGFSRDVPLRGQLGRTSGVVFTYTGDPSAPGPSYWRGLNLQPANLEWRYPSRAWLTQNVRSGEPVDYAESYQETRSVTYNVTMLRPPAAEPTLIFYPGVLGSVNRGVEIQQSGVIDPARLLTADRVIAANAAGAYRLQVLESTATEDQLRAAGTEYPAWLGPYLSLPSGYRRPGTEARIRNLAEQVTAGASNPYDQAVAIEKYLRSGRYTYTLTPPDPPAVADPEDYFLFTSRAGFCQHFATGMADMLGALGVPVRLVNGYGPGAYDGRLGRFVVREYDAHTWPEVYFPKYGWIPFEPTPDGVYSPIPRPTAPAAGADVPSVGAETPTPTSGRADQGARDLPQPAAPGGAGGPRSWLPLVALVLVLLAGLYLALSRYLRPRTAAGVWRRAQLLTQLAGLPPLTGETPIEYGDRVAGAIPEAATDIRRLAGAFAVVAYAPPALARERGPAVLASWVTVRPALMRRVASRLVRRR